MKKRTIEKWFVAAVIMLFSLIASGVAISVLDKTSNRLVFTTFKDLVPLAIAVVAAWLGFCVQRRSAYLQQLRSIWSKLIDAVQAALQYGKFSEPTKEEYAQILLKLSISIDEIRGVFCNLGEEKGKGLFPFEPIKTMYDLIEQLKFGEQFSETKAIEARKQIWELWKEVRKELLKEFDREEPTWSHSHWADAAKAEIYDDHDIPRKVCKSV